MTTHATTAYIITFRCPDRLGIVAKFSSLFYEFGAFITSTAQYSDSETGQFFQRCVFDDRQLALPYSALLEDLQTLADEIDMDYWIRPLNTRQRVLIAVSKMDHCLNHLLNKWKAGVLPIEIVGVVSNHDDCRALVEWYGIPYHHLPITAATKPQQEQQILALIKSERVDLLVLARYMQILSDDFCKAVVGKTINIHHSFLPGFKGAKPYHQAYARGVKVIGATAHYVTEDLDEGPIIVQEVKAVDHSVSVEEMVHLGRDIESVALAQAIKLQIEQRVVLNGNRTVVL